MAQYLIRPQSDVTAQWTRNGGSTNWERVDEPEHDSDTSYNSTSAMSNIDRFRGQNSLIPSGAMIQSVKIHAFIRKVPAQAVNVQLTFVQGATTGFSSDFALTTSYVKYTYDVSGLFSWVPANFNGDGSSMAFGYMHNQAQSREARVTNIWVEVRYDPPVKFKEPGTVVDDSSIGVVIWVLPGQASGSDDAYAKAALSANASHYLKATNFGHTAGEIPDGSTIDGIEVRIERSALSTSTTVTDNSVKIVKGGTISGDEKKSSFKWETEDNGETGNAPISFDEKYGSPTDLWGLSWSPSDIRASGFGVAISAAIGGGTETAQVDNIEITVYFTSDGFEGHTIIY